jgi:hypothetical protein
MRSRAFLLEEEPMPHQPRNSHLVVVASIHEMPRKRSSWKPGFRCYRFSETRRFKGHKERPGLKSPSPC